jgi:hypothetical protein
VREAGTAKRGKFLRVLSGRTLVPHCSQTLKGTRHTHAKEASQHESCEQQDEADGELLVLGDGGCEGLARRGVPELLKRRGRHREYVRYMICSVRDVCRARRVCSPTVVGK